MRRFGISAVGDSWAWADVAVRGDSVEVRRTGTVTAGDWTALAAHARGARSVGIAVPDDRVVVRRIRVGHPPGSAEGLRQLARWRLKDDLPYDSAVLDARMEGDHALVFAADRAYVGALERNAALCGPVERVTSQSLAALAPAVLRDGTHEVVANGSYLRLAVEAGAIASIHIFAGEPTDTAAADRIDLRSGDGLPAGITWPSDLASAERARALTAAGAALDGLRLNLAATPAVPGAALALARIAAAASAAALIASIALFWRTGSLLSTERAALDALGPAPAATAAARPPELAALQALLREGTPEWTRFLASLEREFPSGGRLESLEWSERRLRLSVAADDGAALDAVRVALGSRAAIRSAGQRDGGTLHAWFEVEPES